MRGIVDGGNFKIRLLYFVSKPDLNKAIDPPSKVSSIALNSDRK